MFFFIIIILTHFVNLLYLTYCILQVCPPDVAQSMWGVP